MMSTARRFGANMSALILGALANATLSSFPMRDQFGDIAPRPRVRSGRTGKSYPFSSDRQHQRMEARSYTVTTKSGFEIMQTCRKGEQPGEAMKRAVARGVSVSKSFDFGKIRATNEMRADLRALRAGRAA